MLSRQFVYSRAYRNAKLIVICCLGWCAGFAATATETYVYKKVGPVSIEADVYPIRDGAIHPGILWIHGGALINGDRRKIPVHEFER